MAMLALSLSPVLAYMSTAEGTSPISMRIVYVEGYVDIPKELS